MEIRGKRKFLVFCITIGIFLIITGMTLIVMAAPEATSWDNATLTGLGIFVGALGGALTGISGSFYAGNAVVHKNKNETN